MLGQSRIDFQSATIWVWQPQRPSMQMQPAGDRSAGVGLTTAILTIANDGMPHRRRMGPDLMGSSRNRLKRHPGKAPARLINHPIECLCPAACLRGLRDRDALLAWSTRLGKRSIDHPFARPWNTNDQGPVELLGFPVPQRNSQFRSRLTGPRQ